MSEIMDFLLENKIEILVVVGIVVALLVIINIREINLNEPKPESKLVQQVTVETFEEKNLTKNLTKNLGTKDLEKNLEKNLEETFTAKEVEPSCSGMFAGNFQEFS